MRDFSILALLIVTIVVVPHSLANAQEADPWAPYKAPSTEPAVTYTHDNEKNTSAIYSLRAGHQGLGGRIILGASHREAKLNSLKGHSSYLSGSAIWEGDRSYSRIEAGTNLRGTSGNSATSMFVAGRFSYRPGSWNDKLRIGLNGSVLPFDETARLIAARINVTEGTVDAAFAVTPKVSLLGIASFANISKGITGDASNTRTSASLEAMYLLITGVQAGFGARATSYNRSPSISYFAPKFMFIPEFILRINRGGETGWGVENEEGIGVQTLRFLGSTDNHTAIRTTLALRFRPAVAQEIALFGGFANVASPSTVQATDYKAYTFGLRGRIHF